MVRTDSPTKPLTYAINYGFLGGAIVGRRMQQLLDMAGYRAAAQVETADIIVAHSAGCWELPINHKARLIILVGLPLAKPGPITSFRANRARARSFIKNRHLAQGLEIALLNFYYGLQQPRRNLNIMRRAKHLQAVFEPPAAQQVVMIANQHDPWINSPQLNQLISTRLWSFVGLPGSHDNIWEMPERYVDLINQYARLLA